MLYSPDKLDEALVDSMNMEEFDDIINAQLMQISKDTPLASKFQIRLGRVLPKAFAESLCRYCKNNKWVEADITWTGPEQTCVLTLSRVLYATSTGPGGQD